MDNLTNEDASRINNSTNNRPLILFDLKVETGYKILSEQEFAVVCIFEGHLVFLSILNHLGMPLIIVPSGEQLARPEEVACFLDIETLRAQLSPLVNERSIVEGLKLIGEDGGTMKFEIQDSGPLTNGQILPLESSVKMGRYTIDRIIMKPWASYSLWRFLKGYDIDESVLIVHSTVYLPPDDNDMRKEVPIHEYIRGGNVLPINYLIAPF